MIYFNNDISDNFHNDQYDLDVLLQEYFRLNKLTISVDKSKFMNIHPKNKVLLPYRLLKYNNIFLGEVNEFKYLGITIDKFWDKHISKFLNKISCRVGIIRK